MEGLQYYQLLLLGLVRKDVVSLSVGGGSYARGVSTIEKGFSKIEVTEG